MAKLLRKVYNLDEAFGKSDETKQKESVSLISKAWQKFGNKNLFELWGKSW